MVAAKGVEPLSSSLGPMHSIHLSYGAIKSGRPGGTRTHILFQLCVNCLEGSTNTGPLKNHIH